MWLLSLLSGVLLVLPVAVTVGVYIGIESQRIFHGGDFNGFTTGGNGGGGGGASGGGGGHHKLTTETFCQKAYGITPFPGRYICKAPAFIFHSSAFTGATPSTVGCVGCVDCVGLWSAERCHPLAEVIVGGSGFGRQSLRQPKRTQISAATWTTTRTTTQTTT